jgi:glycosyltransferase involved in cell wall biosynthesis
VRGRYMGLAGSQGEGSPMQADKGTGDRTSGLYINGKFTARPVSGVERVATELVRALDRTSAARMGRWALLCPPGGHPPALRHIEARHVGPPGMALHAWEQAVLPWSARRGLLLNLAGSAPWFAQAQACVVHDAAVFDVPHVYTPLFRWWYRRLFRRHVRRGTRLFTVSSFSQQRLSRALGAAPSALAVVPNGANHAEAWQPDPGALARLGLAGQRFFVAMSGGSRAKNLDAVLAAFGRVRQRHDARLVVVGRPNRRVFAASPATAGRPGVLHAGPVGDDTLRALLDAAVALVFPSLYEGFGLPALEAMACRCPVLASNVAALPEVCGPAALYCDPHSEADIAEAMENLLVDAPLRHRLQEAGVQRSRQFRWDDAAERLLSLLGAPRPANAAPAA